MLAHQMKFEFLDASFYCKNFFVRGMVVLLTFFENSTLVAVNVWFLFFISSGRTSP